MTKAALNREMQIVAASVRKDGVTVIMFNPGPTLTEHQMYLKDAKGMLKTDFTVQNMINTIDKVYADPQVQHLGMAAPVVGGALGDTKVVGSPLNFSGIKKRIRKPTPEAGEHSTEVLQWLGYSQQEIERLRGIGAI